MSLLPVVRIPDANDYVVRDGMGVSVLITRGTDGRARAFLNYCRHRGAVVASGCGSARRHTCPYHAWTYDSSGTLVGIPGKEGFDGIEMSLHGLVELPSEERHGFVWVVMTASVRTIDSGSRSEERRDGRGNPTPVVRFSTIWP